RYLDYQPSTPRDHLVPDDLAVTILINSRATGRAFKSVQDRARDLALADLPAGTLEETTPAERDAVADLVSQVASWLGFGASIATKVLHKKRPDLVPILDNEAIFGAYMNPNWPRQLARQDTIKARSRIREAIEWIATDLTRTENRPSWNSLARMETNRSKIE